MNIQCGPLIANIVKEVSADETIYHYIISRVTSSTFEHSGPTPLVKGECATRREAFEEAEQSMRIMLGSPKQIAA